MKGWGIAVTAVPQCVCSCRLPPVWWGQDKKRAAVRNAGQLLLLVIRLVSEISSFYISDSIRLLVEYQRFMIFVKHIQNEQVSQSGSTDYYSRSSDALRLTFAKILNLFKKRFTLWG